MTSAQGEGAGLSRLDDAARAAWLYYIDGWRQDRIAEEMGVSRQTAQRLVSRAMQEGLIRIRIDHPVAACERLARDLRARFGLELARVAPAPVGAHPSPETGDWPDTAEMRSVAPLAAAELERLLDAPGPAAFAFGSGHWLGAMVDEVVPRPSAGHCAVSLVGMMADDGAGCHHEVAMRLARRVNSRHYPLAGPALATDRAELAQCRDLPHMRQALSRVQEARAAFVGIGSFAPGAPEPMAGIVGDALREELRAAGAVGEICGHAFDAHGRYLDHRVNHLLLGPPAPFAGARTIAVAGGPGARPALRAALAGRLVSGLITDEVTARAVLEA